MANNFMRFDFARAVWRNSTDGGQSFSDAGLCLLAGTLANRPAAGIADRMYFATDTRELYHDTGSSWLLIATQNMLTDSDLESNGGTILQTSNIGKAIGDLPQYEDDGSGNPVLDHPNIPLVGGDAIIEQGSNSDGNFVLFSSGLQVVHNDFDIDLSVSTINTVLGSYPKSFVSEWGGFLSCKGALVNGDQTAIENMAPRTRGVFEYSCDGSGSSTVSFGFTVLGTWK